MNAMERNRENFVLLITGIRNNDRTVKKLTEKDHPVYFKSRYVPPYEDFKELKRLLLLVRSMEDADSEGIIAVDLAEWVGHESEEYFTVMLKYLHDQRGRWSYVFTVADHSRAEVSKLYVSLKTYLTGHIEEDTTFMNAGELEERLFKDYHMQRNAAKEFAGLFMSRDLKLERGYEILESMIGEMERIGSGGRITLASLRKYLGREESLMCVLLGKTVEIKESRYENY